MDRRADPDGGEAGAGWAVAHYNSEGVQQQTYPVPEKGLFIGRTREVTSIAAI